MSDKPGTYRVTLKTEVEAMDAEDAKQAVYSLLRFKGIDPFTCEIEFISALATPRSSGRRFVPAKNHETLSETSKL